MSSDEPRLKKRRVRGRCQLIDCLSHHLLPRDEKIGKRGALRRQRALARQHFSLRVRQRFASRVREQTIRAAGQVGKMETE